MQTSTLASILRSSSDLTEPIHISGATLSSRALLISKYVQAFPNRSPVIVLCPNDEAASELCADLECLSETVDSFSIQVLHFPTWDQSPYSSIALSLRTRLARLSVLSALGTQNFNASPHKQGTHVIVTTIPASCQATLPTSFFREQCISIETDQTIESREAFICRLVECGYLRVDPVEDPGTFSVRGEIIDVFPPHKPQPFRIELFGDLIEKIRTFDPATQRASPLLITSVIFPPAREVLINPATSACLRENIKNQADTLGVHRSVRDPILAAIKNGSYSDHSDAWAPFAYPHPETFWDYLSSPDTSSPDTANDAANWTVLWNDELSCLQEWDEFLQKQTKLFQKLTEETSHSEVIAPPVESLYFWNPPTESRIRAKSKFYLDRIHLANLESIGDTEDDSAAQEVPSESEVSDALKTGSAPISAAHRISIKGNSELEKGTRHSLGDLDPLFKVWTDRKYRILVLASTQSQLERIRFLLEERKHPCQINGALQSSLITLKIGSISEGFRWPAEKLVLLTEGEMLGNRHKKKLRKATTAESGSAAKDWSGLQALSDLSVGDSVVHVEHGIGRYQGLVRLDLSGAPSDFLLLEYANKDKLYLPVYRLNVIQKYVGGEGSSLDRLGSQQFSKTKDKVREAVKKLAIDLVQLYAERKIRAGIPFSPRDAEFREFEAQFPFDETPDQLKAIDAILSDMEAGKMMDRLVCGDVGYGKTEVAIRAAFRAVSDGKQVAVLVPTTILAQQHEQSFKSRLKDYPLTVESVSRFKSSKTQREILESLKQGKVDIIIGTHRLLSKDVYFRDLGLVVVDEEHRFGVEHKERLKTLKINTHVLTLTATPIPRTLHMALSGLRDISLINTPPVDRLPIRTYVSKYDDALIQRAIEFELSRGGQVFFLHNRVQSIHKTALKIRELVPNALVSVGHGQMPETELEQTMMDFYQKKTNVLICTTIIESGIDLPSANTIIINRADSFGLAQLYQIRGRVGRSQQRAYAYLLIPQEGAVTEDAKRRLEVIQKFVELGSGFSVASHDLEIRGGGDLLGAQQSGNIAAVGFDLYTEILEEAIREIQGKPATAEDSHREPEIKTPFPAFLGEEYIPDVHQRLSLYRRFSASTQDSEIDRLEEEIRDRFGAPPLEAQNLLWLIRIKIILKRMGIDALTVGPEKISLLPGPLSKFDPVRAIALVSAHPHQYQLTPDSRLIVKITTGSLRDLNFSLEKLLAEFSVKNAKI